MSMLRRKTAIISGVAGLALAGAVAGGVASAVGGSGASSASDAAGASAVADTSDTAATMLVAQTAGVAAAAKGEGDGAKALCTRAPRFEARIERVLARLNGPATEKGSIAYLQERVQDARAKGDTAIATYLNDRLAFRTSLIGTLRQRETDLKNVQSWCASQHSAS